MHVRLRAVWRRIRRPERPHAFVGHLESQLVVPPGEARIGGMIAQHAGEVGRGGIGADGAIWPDTKGRTRRRRLVGQTDEAKVERCSAMDEAAVPRTVSRAEPGALRNVRGRGHDVDAERVEALLVATAVIQDDARAVELLNRVIAMDSAASRGSAILCHLCTALIELTERYKWLDSGDA